jgi:hypothetical protein
MYGTTGVSDYFVQMLQMYNGDNAREVLDEFERRGFFHSAIPGAEAWSLGIAAVEEIDVIRQALRPVEQKIRKAHLLAVVDDPDDEGQALLKLRSVADSSISYLPVPRGSVLINCTESLGKAAQVGFEPILSDDGLVLSPQTACGFTGPSATMLTHAWYYKPGRLEKIWRKLIRVSLELPKEKFKFGLHALYPLLFNTLTLRLALPPLFSLTDQSSPVNLWPMHRRPLIMLQVFWKVNAMRAKHQKFMTLRFSDPQPEEGAVGTDNESLLTAGNTESAPARARL